MTAFHKAPNSTRLLCLFCSRREALRGLAPKRFPPTPRRRLHAARDSRAPEGATAAAAVEQAGSRPSAFLFGTRHLPRTSFDASVWNPAAGAPAADLGLTAEEERQRQLLLQSQPAARPSSGEEEFHLRKLLHNFEPHAGYREIKWQRVHRRLSYRRVKPVPAPPLPLPLSGAAQSLQGPGGEPAQHPVGLQQERGAERKSAVRSWHVAPHAPKPATDVTRKSWAEHQPWFAAVAPSAAAVPEPAASEETQSDDSIQKRKAGRIRQFKVRTTETPERQAEPVARNPRYRFKDSQSSTSQAGAAESPSSQDSSARKHPLYRFRLKLNSSIARKNSYKLDIKPVITTKRSTDVSAQQPKGWALDDFENVDSPELVVKGAWHATRKRERKLSTRRSRRENADEDEGGYEKRAKPATAAKERTKKEKTERKERQSLAPLPIPEFVSAGQLAQLLKVRLNRFLRRLERLGFEKPSHDYVFGAETAGLIVQEFDREPVFEKTEEVDLHAQPEAADKSLLPTRPPVVTIMGHVDHGKTTILDYLRKSSVAASEHGGITQHIGAFSVTMPGGKVVTFLDTPGHEAFLSMRRRGAHVTDIVVLVVAADDSVKPQTIEAIKHARAANVPMIVAINKMDKPEADAERVRRDLARNGVELEHMGGDTQTICVSGRTGRGLDELESATVALAEVLDLRADAAGACEGWVLEAATKPAGRVATVLVRRGTLRPGQLLVAGATWARVRVLRTAAGAAVAEAGPGTPVEVDGWRDLPDAGAEVLQAPDESVAKRVVEYRTMRANAARLAEQVETMNEMRRADQARRAEEKAKQEEQAAAAAAARRGMDVVAPANADSTTATAATAAAAAATTAGGEAAAAAAAAAADSEPAGPTVVNFIIKADTSGSAEAVSSSVLGIGNELVRPAVLRAGVGAVSETDVEFAATAGAAVLAFNTRAEPGVLRLAEAAAVPLLEHSVIYHVADAVRARLEARLPPRVTQRVTGEAVVAQLFRVSSSSKRKGQVAIAGCKVRNGTIARNAKVRVLRGEAREVVFDGHLSSLKNVKKDVLEMGKGTECGMGFADDWDGFQVDDVVQCYEDVLQKRYL